MQLFVRIISCMHACAGDRAWQLLWSEKWCCEGALRTLEAGTENCGAAPHVNATIQFVSATAHASFALAARTSGTAQPSFLARSVELRCTAAVRGERHEKAEVCLIPSHNRRAGWKQSLPFLA